MIGAKQADNVAYNVRAAHAAQRSKRSIRRLLRSAPCAARMFYSPLSACLAAVQPYNARRLLALPEPVGHVLGLFLERLDALALLAQSVGHRLWHRLVGRRQGVVQPLF